MTVVPIEIVAHKSRLPTAAELHLDLTPSELGEAEDEWGPLRRKAARDIYSAGKIAEVPQHYHWNWKAKSLDLSLIAYRCIGIRCDNRWQGLLMLTLAGREARLPPDRGKPLAYIKYLESAPWNLRALVPDPAYAGIGTMLMRAAVEVSADEGFHGRLGLHALGQSEGFYRDECMMHDCGCDPHVEDLKYYELTRDSASQFALNSGGGGK